MLIKEYNYENCYTLEFMMLKFHDSLGKLELEIACWIDNSNIQKCNFWKLGIEWQTLKMKMKMRNEDENESEFGCFIGERMVFLKSGSFVHWLGPILENWTDTCLCEKWREHDKLSLRIILKCH